MKIYLLCFSLLIGSGLMAQDQLSHTVLSSGGGSSSGCSWTIGQTFAGTLNSGDAAITQGFQQPNLSLTAIKVAHELAATIKVYPNPAEDYVLIEMQTIQGAHFTLTSLSGAVLNSDIIQSDITSVPVNHLAAGTYFVSVSKGKEELGTYQLIKK